MRKYDFRDFEFCLPQQLIQLIQSLEIKKTCERVVKGSSQTYVEIDRVLYPKYLPNFLNRSINFGCLNEQPLKKILLWNTFFQTDYYSSVGSVNPLKNRYCPVFSCEITMDRSLINDSDYVVVHMMSLNDPVDSIPSYRPSNQLWVFLTFESPANNMDANYTTYDRVFNLTSTFRIESDFKSFYPSKGLFEWKRNESFDDSHDYSDGKTKLAAALISNCETTNNRLEYIYSLNDSVRVDVYGDCGTECPTKSCKTFIAEQYKFFLAFENSNCDGYITEKFFDILHLDIVPVVMGSGPYDYYVPRSGYIDVNDFQSASHLANYLEYLDGNKTAYNSYFAWKKYVSFLSYGKQMTFSPFCEMCIRLQLESGLPIKQSVLNNVSNFWSTNFCKNIKTKIKVD